jgi:hypothetical protein
MYTVSGGGGVRITNLHPVMMSEPAVCILCQEDGGGGSRITNLPPVMMSEPAVGSDIITGCRLVILTPIPHPPDTVYIPLV